jgi:hypothetical protein
MPKKKLELSALKPTGIYSFSSQTRKLFAARGNSGIENGLQPPCSLFTRSLFSRFSEQKTCFGSYSLNIASHFAHISSWIFNASSLLCTGFGREAYLSFMKSTLALWSRSRNLESLRGNNSIKSSRYIEFLHKIGLARLSCSVFSFQITASSSST